MQNKNVYMYQKIIIKVVNSLLAIFEEIWLKTMYKKIIVQGILSKFSATLRIHKKSNFDQNQLKLSTQDKYMYMNQKNYKNQEFSPSHF